MRVFRQEGGAVIHRGSIVTYWREPEKPLKVLSDPYDYGGKQCVTAKPMTGKKNERKQAIYALSGLREYDEKNREET